MMTMTLILKQRILNEKSPLISTVIECLFVIDLFDSDDNINTITERDRGREMEEISGRLMVSIHIRVSWNLIICTTNLYT